jgi:hypothetical protein
VAGALHLWGHDIVVPTALLAAVVRVRAFLRAQRLGPRPFQHPGHWAYGVIGLMIGIFIGFAVGIGTRSVEPPPLYLGNSVTAQHFNAVAGRLGCSEVDAVDGELLRDALRRLGRCFHNQDGQGNPH